MRLATPHMMRYRKLEDGFKAAGEKDSGKAGISFVTNEKLPPSSVIDLEINSPKVSRTIKASAKVVRSEPGSLADTYKISVQLINIKDSDRAALYKISEIDLQDKNSFTELPSQYFSIAHRQAATKGEEASVTKDISAGGVAFVSSRDIGIASLIDLEINFPAVDHPVRATARVVRVEPLKKGNGYRIGAQFVKIDENDKHSIDDFIKHVSGGRRQRQWWWRKIR